MDGGYSMGKKILIIDDNHDIVIKLKRFLDGKGYEVFAAEDWSKGFEGAYRKKPNLIILDTQFADEWGSRFFWLCLRKPKSLKKHR